MSVLDGNEQNPRIKLFETFGATVAGAAGRRRRPRADRQHRRQGLCRCLRRQAEADRRPLGTEDFGFIFPKGSDLVAPINAGDRGAEGRRHLDALNKKWFLDYKMGQ
jgi:polar amino acid transport system substrate-binding protein